MTRLIALLPIGVITISWIGRLALGKTFKIGLLMPYTGRWAVGRLSAGAMTLAINKVNHDPSLTLLRDGGHDFAFDWRDTKCHQGEGLRQISDMYFNSGKEIDAFIGPACDTVCEVAALLAAEWGIPMISFGCGSILLSDKTIYPTFARTFSPYHKMAPFIIKVFQTFHWSRVLLLVSPTSTWVSTAHVLREFLENSGIEVREQTLFKDTSEKNENNMSELIKAKKMARVILICAGSETTHAILTQASDLDLFNGQYAFLTFDLHWSNFRTSEASDHTVFEGILDFTYRNRESDIDDVWFSSYVLTASGEPPFHQHGVHIIDTKRKVDAHSTLLYNSVLYYATVVDSALSLGVDPSDHAAMVKHLFNTTFNGLTGPVDVNVHGESISDYSLRNFQNNSFVAVFDYLVRNETLVDYGTTLLWPGGGSTMISGAPPCGWNNEICNQDTNMIVAVLVTTIACAFACLVIYKLYRRRRQEVEMASLAWKVDFKDIRMGHLGGSRSHFGSRISKNHLASDEFNSRKDSLSGKSALTDSLSHMGQQQIFTKLGHFKGQVVAIKQVRKPFVYLSVEIIHELNTVRNMPHANLNQFIGACVDPNHICVISAYCSKGSLQDVLENDNLKLDRIFKLSFASDIAQGMVYLHESPIGFHGNLKSSNVLIDSRWTCKITDFGLRQFRDGERPISYGDHAYYYRLLWTAPEHLREDETVRTGSQKGDVYSFAIVLQEIILRSTPFSSHMDDPQVLIERIRKPEHPAVRPKILAQDSMEELLDLMRVCWEEIPAFRPNFVTIRDSVKKLNEGRQTNLVDQMMHMMEKYADHLEELVEDRTKQLAEEQKKTDELLARMLPKLVADELKMGRNVAPESFSSCTIFFSDVVGFTALAAASKPLQVVDFLNDLYTCFDNIIEHYDVYKVETIGDAYMVVSGLPVRNGNRHAGEICTMALDLLSAIKTFRIRHQPHKHLQLRVGIHTGPAVAGVVGLKMPRYCLFGDTVNYASRMESSGLALRIHVSPQCKAVLDSLGGYKLEERGLVCMKGKGNILTYYLTGKDGFNKSLPDLSLAAAMDEHEFK